MKYLSKCNQIFKNRYKKHQDFINQKPQIKSFENNESQSALMKNASDLNSLKESVFKNSVNSVFANRGKKQKTQRPGKLKKKKTNFFSEMVRDDAKESFLITQSALINPKENNQKPEFLMKRKPFLRLFEEKKFLREIILEEIEKVKIEKKWMSA